METLVMPSKSTETPLISHDDKADTLPSISPQGLVKGGASPSLVTPAPGVELPKLVAVSHASDCVVDGSERRRPKPVSVT